MLQCKRGGVLEENFKTIYDELDDISDWAKLNPGEIQYMRYPTNVIFAALKIVDIYYTLCIARVNLHFLDNKDFGDYAKDELAIKFVKSMHIQNSLIFYNIAVDYSWQVLWLFYNKWLNQETPTSDLYEYAIEGCNYQELLLGLTLVQDYKMRDLIVKPFFDRNTAYQAIRPMYNYLKHRGTFYFDGLGTNRSKMWFGFNKNGTKVDLPLVTRKEMDVKHTKKLLLQFDKDFVRYMSILISAVIQSNFCSTTISMTEWINGLLNKY